MGLDNFKRGGKSGTGIRLDETHPSTDYKGMEGPSKINGREHSEAFMVYEEKSEGYFVVSNMYVSLKKKV